MIERVDSAPVDRLIDHIVNTHHAYARQALLAIARQLRTLLDTHGSRYLQLAAVAKVFAALASDLTQHMLKEERVLFPYVRDLAEHASELCGRVISPFGTVENPIRMMEREHQQAADAMRLIRDLTGGYSVPDDASAMYGACMAELARFERDLDRHVFLENNVLFPRALALEGRSIRGASAARSDR